jgi:hypothetical protein
MPLIFLRGIFIFNTIFDNRIMYKAPQLTVKIKTNSKRARLAAFKLGTKSVAMVWGNTILLHNVTRENFFKNIAWVRHEVRHVQQSKKLGKYNFLWRYFILSFKHGYRNHPFEIDARLHEQDENVLNNVVFI